MINLSRPRMEPFKTPKRMSEFTEVEPIVYYL